MGLVLQRCRRAQNSVSVSSGENGSVMEPSACKNNLMMGKITYLDPGPPPLAGRRPGPPAARIHGRSSASFAELARKTRKSPDERGERSFPKFFPNVREEQTNALKRVWESLGTSSPSHVGFLPSSLPVFFLPLMSCAGSFSFSVCLKRRDSTCTFGRFADYVNTFVPV